MGAESMVTLPLPDTVTIREAASLAEIESVENLALMLNCPTPPAKEDGAPAGRGVTRKLIVGVATRLRTV